MARKSWIQVKIGDAYKLIPKEEYHAFQASRTEYAFVHGDIESFVSPVDGSIITDRAQLREHNIRNNVVDYQEYGEGHWDRAKKKRQAYRDGNHDQAEIRAEMEKAHYQHAYGLPGTVRKGPRR